MSKTFAQLSGNTVTNVIVAETKEDAELVTGSVCIEYTPENPAGIGWVYDSESATFTNPNLEIPTEEPAPTEG